jgi:hypothetical protein
MVLQETSSFSVALVGSCSSFSAGLMSSSFVDIGDDDDALSVLIRDFADQGELL